MMIGEDLPVIHHGEPTEGGEVRVKDGIALAHGTKTPLLRKCGP